MNVSADVSICEAPQQVDLPGMRQQTNAVDCSTNPAMQHHTSQPELKQLRTSRPEPKQHHMCQPEPKQHHTSQPPSWGSGMPHPYLQQPKADMQQPAHMRLAAKEPILCKGQNAEQMVMSGDLGTSQVRFQNGVSAKLDVAGIKRNAHVPQQAHDVKHSSSSG